MTAAAEEPARRGRRLKTVVGAIVVVSVVTSIAATVLGTGLRSPEQVAADAAPPRPSVVTAAAERRVLAQPVTLRATVVAGASTKIAMPASAAGPASVITAVRVKVGSSLREGQVAVERSGRPMIVLALRFPLYRDLLPGMTGPDVREVQRALRRMGYRVGESGTYDGATQAAVQRLYRARGYRVEGPAPVPPAGTPGGSPPAGGAPAEKPAAGFLAQAEVLRVTRSAGKVSKVHVRVGDVMEDPRKVMLELDDRPPTVRAVVARDQALVLRAGQRAVAVDEIAGTESAVEVASVGRQPATAANGEAGFPIDFRFLGTPLSVSTTSSIRVQVQVEENSEKVLAVPVSAIYSRADGSAFVTIVDGSDTQDVTVEAGPVVGGWVEIMSSAGERLQEGTDVAVGAAPDGAG